MTGIKRRKSKSLIINRSFFILGLFILSIATAVSFTVAKMTTNFGTVFVPSRAATFDVVIDGVPTDTVNYKILATSKVSDIRHNVDTYTGNSFIEGAYRANSIVIHNNSEVKAEISLGVDVTNNDSRVFYAVLPNCATEQEIYQKLYTQLSGSTIPDVQDMCDYFNSSTYTIGSDDYLRLTLVIWVEHDAVYVDTDNDGVADEYDKKMNQLVLGVPAEDFTVKCYVTQKD